MNRPLMLASWLCLTVFSGAAAAAETASGTIKLTGEVNGPAPNGTPTTIEIVSIVPAQSPADDNETATATGDTSTSETYDGGTADYELEPTVTFSDPNGTGSSQLHGTAVITIKSTWFTAAGDPVTGTATVTVTKADIGGEVSVDDIARTNTGGSHKVCSNGADAVYSGLGAGGSQVAGVDGLGTWHAYEEMRGNTLTVLGDFGYRASGWYESACVLGPAIPGLRIDFPVLVAIELDGVAPFGGSNVFTRPACGAGGPFPLGNSAGFAPYGTPTGSSASFLLAGLPSGAGFPSSTAILLPNVGLQPSSSGGTATLIAAGSSSLPIASTGFCWVVQFGWAPSALASVDDINGWWFWRTNGRDGNQYWSVSTDELNIWQSQTVMTDGGQTALLAFFSNLDYDTHLLAVNPETNSAFAPAGSNGTGVYYATGAGVPQSGASLNGGFDLGRHSGGLSMNGLGGTVNPGTGLGHQNPAGSPTPGLVPSLGFVTWDSTVGSSFRTRLTWIGVDNELTLGLDPAANIDVTLVFGTVRVPLSVSQIPGPFPQPTTSAFFSLYVHTLADQTGQTAWPDPMGFPGGTFGVLPMVGSTIHLPTLSPPVACIGLPLGLRVGSSALDGPGGPLLWSRNMDAPSSSVLLPIID